MFVYYSLSAVMATYILNDENPSPKIVETKLFPFPSGGFLPSDLFRVS
jgi:hypothetical protein